MNHAKNVQKIKEKIGTCETCGGTGIDYTVHLPKDERYAYDPCPDCTDLDDEAWVADDIVHGLTLFDRFSKRPLDNGMAKDCLVRVYLNLARGCALRGIEPVDDFDIEIPPPDNVVDLCLQVLAIKDWENLRIWAFRGLFAIESLATQNNIDLEQAVMKELEG
jgi:hypothetical protein